MVVVSLVAHKFAFQQSLKTPNVLTSINTPTHTLTYLHNTYKYSNTRKHAYLCNIVIYNLRIFYLLKFCFCPRSFLFNFIHYYNDSIFVYAMLDFVLYFVLWYFSYDRIFQCPKKKFEKWEVCLYIHINLDIYYKLYFCMLFSVTMLKECSSISNTRYKCVPLVKEIVKYFYRMWVLKNELNSNWEIIAVNALTAVRRDKYFKLQKKQLSE